MSLTRSRLAVAAVAVSAATALPTLGPAGERAPGPAWMPPPSPGDAQVSAEELAEERRTASAGEQRDLVAALQRVVDCARARGVAVPDPQPHPNGAILPWPEGQPTRAANAAVEACFE